MRCRTRMHPRDEGAAAVEFALVLTLFLTLVFGIIQYSFYFFQSQAASSTSREASRLAAVGVDNCTTWKDSVLAAARANGLGASQVPNGSRISLTFQDAGSPPTTSSPTTGGNALVTITWTPTNFTFPFLPFISGNQTVDSQTRVESVGTSSSATC